MFKVDMAKMNWYCRRLQTLQSARDRASKFGKSYFERFRPDRARQLDYQDSFPTSAMELELNDAYITAVGNILVDGPFGIGSSVESILTDEITRIREEMITILAFDDEEDNKPT